jgi:hypothetical protein
MDSFSKTGIVLAIVVVIFNSKVAIAQTTSSQSDLQAVFSIVPNSTSTSMFEIQLTNTG